MGLNGGTGKKVKGPGTASYTGPESGTTVRTDTSQQWGQND